jgi:hypothetical protein
MTYDQLNIPSAHELRGYTVTQRVMILHHNAMLAKRRAKVGNWGSVITETEIVSKTSKGALETEIHPDGSITHRWSRKAIDTLPPVIWS